MNTFHKDLTTLEKRRVKDAKLCILCLLVGLMALALWQCAESTQLLSHIAGIFNDSAQESTGASTTGGYSNLATDPWAGKESRPDPLSIRQEGIEFVEANSDGRILWYQSGWDTLQSRILVERALIFGGWQSLSSSEEQVMSFSFAQSATAAGGSLIVSFYRNDQGCSVLFELF